MHSHERELGAMYSIPQILGKKKQKSLLMPCQFCSSTIKTHLLKLMTAFA